MLKALRPLLGPTSVRPGCISCRIYQDLGDVAALTWIEERASRADLDLHILSSNYCTLLSVLEMSAVPPEVRFDIIAHTEGLKLIQDTRREPRLG